MRYVCFKEEQMIKFRAVVLLGLKVWSGLCLRRNITFYSLVLKLSGRFRSVHAIMPYTCCIYYICVTHNSS